jgi:hypothetical protein
MVHSDTPARAELTKQIAFAAAISSRRPSLPIGAISAEGRASHHSGGLTDYLAAGQSVQGNAVS